MYFDRFDVVIAHYLFCSDYHEGQGSYKYERLCKIGRYFKPSPLMCGIDDESENAQTIYANLEQRGSDNDY